MEQRALSNGFEEFLTWSEEDLIEALRSGLVVVDTNVLLDLYRYDPEVRKAMLDVLHRLDDRLFVPDQVAREFWRNRESALEDREATAVGVVEKISGGAQTIESSVNQWRNRSGALSANVQTLLDGVLEAIESIADEIRNEASGTTHNGDTSADEVLSGIVAVTSGRIGSAPSDDERAQHVAEGLRRAELAIPPGYKDADKEGDGPAGDYLVWRQTLDEATERCVDRILIVTSDQKEDWVRHVQGQKRGIRRELRREALDKAKADVALVTPRRLLEVAEDALNVDVAEETVSKLAAIGTQSNRDWDEANIAEFRKLVAAEDPKRAAVLDYAIQNDGHVSRDRVYELCDFAEDRSLRGFTRPYSRLKQELIRRGYLSAEAEDPVVAVYRDPYSYVLASGFEVPDAFLAS